MHGERQYIGVEVVQYVYPSGDHYLNAIALDAVLWADGQADETALRWRELGWAMLTAKDARAVCTSLGPAVVSGERVAILTKQAA